MSSFTENFFKNQSTTKTSTNYTTNKTTKKNKEYDVDDFTNSFFDDYNSTNYSAEFVKEYNDFIDRLNNGISDRYTEAINKMEQASSYYDTNKEKLKEERSSNLIYNWDLKSSGGIYNSYGNTPKQDKNGYLKQTDSNGNVYWLDAKNNIIYDSNYNVANIDTKSLKYEYDSFNKLDTNNLTNSDKLGLALISEEKYNSIFTTNNSKVIPNGIDTKPNSSSLFEKKNFEDTLPNKVDMNTNHTNDLYKQNFDKLNTALEKGDLTTANNALESINKLYFGHAYNDSLVASLTGSVEKNNSWMFKKFEDNVARLDVINDSIKNTSDANVIESLTREKDKLELENTLIQYNRICGTQSIANKLNSVNVLEKHKDEVWDNVKTLWSETFDELDDGYQFGDTFKTIKNIFNNSVQSIAASAIQTNDGIKAVETLLASDLDDSKFKETWLPAIIDVGTYIIPYIGTARFYLNIAEPAAVAESFITQEKSATIKSKDGEPRVASGLNAVGAIVNIAANMLSDKIFSAMRIRLGEEGVKKIYDNTARGIAALIFKDAAGEGIEEFVQTYAEVLQDTNEDLLNDKDAQEQFWTDNFNEALESALVAFVTAGIASGTSIAIDAIRTGNIQNTMINKAELKSIDQKGEIENVKLNKDLVDNGDIAYVSSDTKKYEKINNNKLDTSDVIVDTDEKIITDIAENLANNNIISILDTDSIKTTADINLDEDINSTVLADTVVNNNTKTVLVGSKELETYLKSLNPNLTTYVFDPKSDTFLDDIRAYVKDVAKQNIVPKNVSDFTVNEYKFTPNEMNDINNMVNEYINKGNILDTVNNPTEYKLNPITVSDITDSDINTIMNSIRTKFLNEIDNNRLSKETAQKEFKLLNNKLSDYVLKTKETRTYLKDKKNNIIVFAKNGNNVYEAVNTLPKTTADLSILANVKTNGNIINGNLSTKVEFTNKQLNAVNTLIDKLKLKGNYLTSQSTYKDLASLVKLNQNMSKEILQSLGADGLIEGKNKVRLYTAFDNLDNANFGKAVKNTVEYLKSDSFKTEIKKKSETVAPIESKLPVQETKVDINEKPIDVEKYASNPENPSELNNIELEKIFDDSFKDLTLTDKIAKNNINDLKNLVKNVVFDGYSHIVDIANANEDYSVKQAIYDLQAVASDAQTMITGAQMKNGDVIGKSLKQIYPDNNIKSKKDKDLFEKTMLHALNAEREKAGVEKIFENISAKKSEAIVNKLFEKHPNFKEAANDLQRYNNNLLDLLVDGGVISEELSNTLKDRYKYYMPIYSSDLASFADLGSEKYLKSLSLDNSIKDVTKTSKQILSLEKSLENKTYNVLSAIAKNKLAQEMSLNENYTGNSDLLFYENGKLTKTKVSNEILSDINNNTASHIADVIHDLPVLKQAIDLSNLSYKFILDPIYQLKNITIDFADSALIYSKDKGHFIPNYIKAIQAVANNSELYHECLENGLGNIGEGWNSPKVEYDADGNIITKQNKFQRVYANLEALPKIAEYISLKDKYMKQARLDYDSGKYDKNNFNKSVVKNDDGSLKHVYHGTDAYGFTEFSKDYNDKNRAYSNLDTLVSFFSDRKENAQTYTRNKDNIYDVYLNIQKPLIVECDGKAWSALDSDSNPFNKTTTDEIIKDAIKSGKYDGVIFNNIQDRGPKFHGKLESYTANDYVVFDNSQIIQSHLYNNDTNISFKQIQDTILKQAMLDASDVNLNFNRGGKVVKALSKSGFKFLNAGIQGFDKFVTHVGEGVKTPKGMGSLLLEFTAVGVTTAIANALLNGDDEEYDKLPYYYKNNYYMFRVGDNKYFRIPKGRVQALYDVLFEYATGLREEDSAQDYIESLQSAFDSAVLPPALENASPVSAYVQLFENKDAFGNEIYDKKYDSTEEKIRSGVYHLLGNYFGRYGRIVKDITDDNPTTDLFNEFDFYKDTTKANRHYNTALNLVEYYQNANNVKTLDDKAMKKYIDTQNYALRSINSEINQGIKAGQNTKDLQMKYAARDDLLLSMISNYKNFDKEVDEDGNTWYYFDEHCFMYNAKTEKFVKKY